MTAIMNELPREELRALVVQHGQALYTDPQRCEALLRERCGEYSREVFVLVSALREGIVADLLAVREEPLDAGLLISLARRLQENLALAEDAALWAVETWASALDVGGQTPGALVLVVSPQGPGRYRSIGEALREAQPGARILVRPGVYNESLVIRDRVEIQGDGPVEEIVLTSEGTSCLQMQAEHAVVRGLTLRALAADQEQQCYAVDIPQGQLVLEDCDISSESMGGVAVHGSQAEPIIRRCRIHDTGGFGVSFYGRARGLVEECDFFGNAYAEIEVCDGSDPHIRRCRIHDGHGYGIWVYRKGKGVIEDCEIFDNAKAGIRAEKGSNPIIEGDAIQDPVVTNAVDVRFNRRVILLGAVIGAIVLGLIGRNALGIIFGVIFGTIVGVMLSAAASALLGEGK